MKDSLMRSGQTGILIACGVLLALTFTILSMAATGNSSSAEHAHIHGIHDGGHGHHGQALAYNNEATGAKGGKTCAHKKGASAGSDLTSAKKKCSKAKGAKKCCKAKGKCSKKCCKGKAGKKCAKSQAAKKCSKNKTAKKCSKNKAAANATADNQGSAWNFGGNSLQAAVAADTEAVEGEEAATENVNVEVVVDATDVPAQAPTQRVAIDLSINLQTADGQPLTVQPIDVTIPADGKKAVINVYGDVIEASTTQEVEEVAPAATEEVEVVEEAAPAATEEAEVVEEVAPAAATEEVEVVEEVAPAATEEVEVVEETAPAATSGDDELMKLINTKIELLQKQIQELEQLKK